jgi:hypothetical protein
MIVHRKDGWHVLSEKGKNLGGPYSSRSAAVHRLQQVEYFKHKGKAGALGIPDRDVKTRPREFSTPENWHFNVQQHKAHKAGEHFDLRLVDPRTGIAHSWAARNLPKFPGEKVLAVHQPDHTAEYSAWSGEIKSGYGAGTVKLFSADKVEVTKSTPDHVSFNVYKSNGDTEKYTLIHTGGDDWLFMNSTPTRDTRPEVNISKPKFQSIKPESIDVTKSTEILAPKYDGAMNAFLLRRGMPIEIYSYRPSKKGPAKLINHTFRTGLHTAIVPESMPGKTVLLGELFAKDRTSGNVLSSRDTAARLLSNVWRSRELQENAPLDHVVFDVVRYQGKDVSSHPYSEKLEILKNISKEIPELKMPPLATTINEKQVLLDEIRSGNHPLTQEGVVVYDLNKSVPLKAKLFKDYDVRIMSVFPGEGKYKNKAAGGFTYSYNGKEEIGRVGSGFTDQMRKEMFELPNKYVGQVARVLAQEKLPSGALRMPVYKDIRSETWPRRKQAALLEPFHKKAPDPKIHKGLKTVQTATLNDTSAPMPVLGDSMSNYHPAFTKTGLIKLKFKPTRPDAQLNIARLKEMRIPPDDPQQMQTEDSIPILGDNLANMPKTGGIDWKHMTKEYLLPSLVAGPVIGTAVTAATSSKNEFNKNIGKGIATGIGIDLATGLSMGLWNQRKNLKKLFKTKL